MGIGFVVLGRVVDRSTLGTIFGGMIGILGIVLWIFSERETIFSGDQASNQKSIHGSNPARGPAGRPCSHIYSK